MLSVSMAKDPENGADKALLFRYTFSLDDGKNKVFEVRLDPDTLNIIPPKNAGEPPEWTRLGYHPCEHCPLTPETRYCPIAVNIAPVVEGFKDIISWHTTNVTVETHDRTLSKRASVQSALYPLIGLYMAASGCPVMEKLKPMVRYHLPFSGIEETIYRVMTMYIAAQYMRLKSGLKPDWELAGVTTLYNRIKEVNEGFCKRLSKAVEEDALVNSVVILDVFASMIVTPSDKSEQLLRRLFAPYLQEKDWLYQQVS